MQLYPPAAHRQPRTPDASARPRATPAPLLLPLVEERPSEVGKISPQSQPAEEQWPDASGEIANLMLQGWTLLASHCPR